MLTISHSPTACVSSQTNAAYSSTTPSEATFESSMSLRTAVLLVAMCGPRLPARGKALPTA